MKISSVKVQLGIFLAVFGLCISFLGRDFLLLKGILFGLLCAILADTLINYIKNKKLVITESSLISGLIIGYVISSDLEWWIIGLASILAISSKHLVRFRGRHIFNPAALGIFLTTLSLGVFTQWKAAYAWYIIVPAGLYFIFKIRKFEIVLSYFLVSMILYGAQALMHRVSLLNILGYLNYFFIFIMLIEPRTTPFSRTGKLLFGAGVAILTFIFYQTGVRLEVELLALLCFNLLTPLLNKITSHFSDTQPSVKLEGGL
ncbi:MAG: RnfABCDGE type electron transport complex subunit D [Candidatus Omnitrophica bacterium]|nr:RnfABCDGE type electron transport complex subunit D [Candidatus Omnitrophota bacterium]